jgi:hypothetical protein
MQGCTCQVDLEGAPCKRKPHLFGKTSNGCGRSEVKAMKTYENRRGPKNMEICQKLRQSGVSPVKQKFSGSPGKNVFSKKY